MFRLLVAFTLVVCSLFFLVSFSGNKNTHEFCFELYSQVQQNVNKYIVLKNVNLPIVDWELLAYETERVSQVVAGVSLAILSLVVLIYRPKPITSQELIEKATKLKVKEERLKSLKGLKPVKSANDGVLISSK